MRARTSKSSLVLPLAAVIACGGGSPTGGAAGDDPLATDPTGGGSEPAPPAHASCRVVVEEAGGQSRTSEYSFESGVLTEVVVTDGVSGRSYTTRYSWDDARRAVRVEKLAEGQAARPPMVMRYEGSRQSGRVVGKHVRDEVLLEQITWHYDDDGRPVRRDHEWLPTPEERANGLEARVESDACSYDGEGRPATFELILEGEPVLLIFYRYEAGARYPSGIVEKHIVGPEVPPRDNSIAEVDAQLRVTWPGEGADRTTRYEGDCRAVFFPAVCSEGAAP